MGLHANQGRLPGSYGRPVVEELTAWARYSLLRKCSHVPVSRPPRHDREYVLCRAARDKSGWFARPVKATAGRRPSRRLRGRTKISPACERGRRQASPAKAPAALHHPADSEPPALAPDKTVAAAPGTGHPCEEAGGGGRPQRSYSRRRAPGKTPLLPGVAYYQGRVGSLLPGVRTYRSDGAEVQHGRQSAYLQGPSFEGVSPTLNGATVDAPRSLVG